MVEKLAPDAQKVIQQILDTEVKLPLKTVLGNMPEVRKAFQTGYTAEEFEKIEVNLAAQALVSEDEDNSEEDLGPRIQVNSLSLGQLPDYVLVEASAGKVTQCYRIDAEHWTDAQISHVQQNIIPEEDHEVGLAKGDTNDDQREYDRSAGIEHLRRTAPKFRLIFGQHFPLFVRFWSRTQHDEESNGGESKSPDYLSAEKHAISAHGIC
ncbi:hypothetical protein P3342_004273 [Pyrenophora teres f. teres]|nr:hypothetical protein P3342_004273 [Pyrenophora teres f. teres]